MLSNQDYINEYIITRGLSWKTERNLRVVIKHYCNYQKANLHELIQEADQEEEQGIRWKNRKLKHRLTHYTNHLKTSMHITSAKTYLTIVKSFYTHNDIEIGKLPALNLKNAKITQPITYNDLPTREIIRDAVNLCNPLWRSIILFLVNTGVSKVDLRSLTVNDFIIATQQYHHSRNLTEVLQELKKADNIVPVWRNRRSKTNKYFVTFNTDECTREIINQLTIRNNKQPLSLDDKLFPVEEHYYTRKFEEINEQLGLGTAGTYNRFRGHMLRKYHATTLENAGMNRSAVNLLQGKSNGKVDEVYFFADEERLKNDFIKYSKNLMVFTEFKTVDAPEVSELKKQNKELMLQVEKLLQLKEEVDKIMTWYKM